MTACLAAWRNAAIASMSDKRLYLARVSAAKHVAEQWFGADTKGFQDFVCVLLLRWRLDCAHSIHSRQYAEALARHDKAVVGLGKGDSQFASIYKQFVVDQDSTFTKVVWERWREAVGQEREQ